MYKKFINSVKHLMPRCIFIINQFLFNNNFNIRQNYITVKSILFQNNITVIMKYFSRGNYYIIVSFSI